jgi:hypothetical protein
LALVAWLVPAPLNPADAAAVNLVTDGNFQNYTNMGTYGGYVCNSGTASSCVSNLTHWSATCSTTSRTTGCNTSDTPTSLLISPGNNGSAWNGTQGLYSYTAPSVGNAVADDGDSNYDNTLFQSIAGLSIGGDYTLTFYQAAAQQNGLTGATTEKWQVTLGSQTQDSTTMNNASHGFVPFSQVSMNFVATATTETLSFLSLGTPAGEPPIAILAEVDLVVIPEPGTAAMMAAGLFGLVLLRRRRAPKTCQA